MSASCEHCAARPAPRATSRRSNPRRGCCRRHVACRAARFVKAVSDKAFNTLPTASRTSVTCWSVRARIKHQQRHRDDNQVADLITDRRYTATGSRRSPPRYVAQNQDPRDLEQRRHDEQSVEGDSDSGRAGVTDRKQEQRHACAERIEQTRGVRDRRERRRPRGEAILRPRSPRRESMPPTRRSSTSTRASADRRPIARPARNKRWRIRRSPPTEAFDDADRWFATPATDQPGREHGCYDRGDTRDPRELRHRTDG